MKKILSVFLSWGMVFAMLPAVNVFAATEYSNSTLVDCVILTTHKNDEERKGRPITRITPHCMAGGLDETAEDCGRYFRDTPKHVSSNYGIGNDGKIGLYVEEKDRAWTSYSWDNDSQAVTIECASSKDGKQVTEATWNSLVKLCTDICTRYHKEKLIWIPDKDRALAYEPKSNEMLLTIHKWFTNTICPGEFLLSRMGLLADTVTRNLYSPIPWVSAPFAIKTDAVRASKSIYAGVGTNPTSSNIGIGEFVITEVSLGPESTYGWGKLGDGRGWINLDFTSYGPLTVKIENDIRASKLIYAGVGINPTSSNIGRGVFAIAEVRQVPGSTCGWGRLGDGRGWINLDFTSYNPYKESKSSIPWVSAPFAIKTDAVRANQLVYKGAGINTGSTGAKVGNGTFVITEVSPDSGSIYGWGKLGDGRGWINLDYTSYGPLAVDVKNAVRAKQLIYAGAGINTSSTGIMIGEGTFKIAEIRQGPGSTCGWGKLGNGYGWLNLDYTSYNPYKASASSIPWVKTPLTVEVAFDDRANQLVYKGAGTGATDTHVGKGKFEITQVSPSPGSTYGWGKLKDGRGWINLDYTSFAPLEIEIKSERMIYTGAGTNTSSTGIKIGKGKVVIAEFKSGDGSQKGWVKLGDGRGWISLD